MSDLRHRIELAIMGRTAPKAAEAVMAIVHETVAAALVDAAEDLDANTTHVCDNGGLLRELAAAARLGREPDA